MVDYNNYGRSGDSVVRTGTHAADEGLRSYMLRVYNYMGLGIGVTALVTMFFVVNPQMMATVAMGPMKWVVFAAVLGLGWFSSKLIFSGNTFLAQGSYWLYAALWGALISPMIFHYLNMANGGTLVMRAFLITALTFGSMSFLGYVTKKNLSGLGTFFMMATIGLIIATLLNVFFFQSEFYSIVVSCLVVLVFSGITAYETQAIKHMYYSADGTTIQSYAIFGAFMLYGSFITLFIHILNILGSFND